jgi:hypothetical protein
VAGQETISSWTPELLTKFIRDLFTNQPPDFLPHLRAEEITVDRKLTLRDVIVFGREPNFRTVGGTGQPAFQHSWVNFGSNWAEAAFWRDPLGFVHLRGLIKSGTVDQSAFTLPPGFRPKVNEAFVTVSNGAVGRVDVLTDGTVTPASPSNNAWVSLSGIHFRTS